MCKDYRVEGIEKKPKSGLLSLQQIIDSTLSKYKVLRVSEWGCIYVAESLRELGDIEDCLYIPLLSSYTGSWKDSVTYRTGHTPPVLAGNVRVPKQLWELPTLRGVIIQDVEYRAEVLDDLLYVLKEGGEVKLTSTAYKHLEGVAYDGSKLDLCKTSNEEVKDE